MYTNEHHNQPRESSELTQSYLQFRERLKQKRLQIAAPVDTEILDGIESFATDNPDSHVAEIRRNMLRAIEPDTSASDPNTAACFSDLYKKACDIVYPATTAFLDTCNAVNELSSNHSLSSMGLEELRAIDRKAHQDTVLNTFRTELITKLGRAAANIDNVMAFSQAFETYGEIVAYLHLRERMPTERLPERGAGKSTPDFRCEPRNSKPFHVEVKTFDIVGGAFRNRSMMDESLDTNAELEEQIRAGKPIASATIEVAPYLRSDETDGYNPYSLIRVINTLREKSFEAFKEGQFKNAPTLALAVLDRLLLPGCKFDLAPYYSTDFNDGGIASGVLWHMAYGRPGTPIFRVPTYAGAKPLEGHLDKFGLFVDEANPFPAPGLIILYSTVQRGNHHAFGLVNEAYSGTADWSIDDTYDVLGTICHRWNDEDGSRSWDISACVAGRGE